MLKNLERFGMPVLIELETLEEQIALCKNLGLNFLELNMNLPAYTNCGLKKIDLVKLSKEHNIDFTIHLPEAMCLGELSNEIREGYTKLLNILIDQLPKDSVKTMVMHFNKGVKFTLPDKKVYLKEKYLDVYLDNIRHSMEEVVPKLKEKNILLCAENTGILGNDFIQKGLELFLSYENTGLAWDIGHDAMSDYADYDFYQHHLDKVKHIHLHDYNGETDHCALYTGTIDIDRIVEFAAKNNVRTCVEVKTKEMLAYSIASLKSKYEIDQ